MSEPRDPSEFAEVYERACEHIAARDGLVKVQRDGRTIGFLTPQQADMRAERLADTAHLERLQTRAAVLTAQQRAYRARITR